MKTIKQLQNKIEELQAEIRQLETRSAENFDPYKNNILSTEIIENGEIPLKIITKTDSIACTYTINKVEYGFWSVNGSKSLMISTAKELIEQQLKKDTNEDIKRSL